MTGTTDRIHAHAEKLRNLGTELISRVESFSTELAEHAIDLQAQLHLAEHRAISARKRVRRPTRELTHAAKKLAREVRRSCEQIVDVLR